MEVDEGTGEDGMPKTDARRKTKKEETGGALVEGGQGEEIRWKVGGNPGADRVITSLTYFTAS